MKISPFAATLMLPAFWYSAVSLCPAAKSTTAAANAVGVAVPAS